jgi:hypothetical protein
MRQQKHGDGEDATRDPYSEFVSCWQLHGGIVTYATLKTKIVVGNRALLYSGYSRHVTVGNG